MFIQVQGIAKSAAGIGAAGAAISGGLTLSTFY